MKAQQSEAVFGAFDGMTSLLGLLAGALVAHASTHALLLEVLGLAVASAVGMAAGDYLSGKSLALSLVMGAATLLGSVLPAVPVLVLHGATGQACGVVVALSLAAVIAEVRSRETGRARGYLSTGIVLILTAGLSIAVALLAGATG